MFLKMGSLFDAMSGYRYNEIQYFYIFYIVKSR